MMRMHVVCSLKAAMLLTRKVVIQNDLMDEYSRSLRNFMTDASDALRKS